MSLYKGNSKIMGEFTVVNEEQVKEIVDSEMTTKGVCTTKVTNVPVTSTSSFEIPEVTGSISYLVRNGVCYVNIWGLQSTKQFNHYQQNLLNLPVSYIDFGTPIINNISGELIGFIYLNAGNPILKCNFYVTNVVGYGSFSYPVVES